MRPGHRRVWAAIGVAAVSATPVRAAVERAIAVQGPGRVVVTLDRDVYERARADLGDLRVRDGAGAEVPFLLERVAEAPVRQTRQPAIRNRAFTRGQQVQATLDFGVPTLKSEITLSLSGDNFRRRVKVEGRAPRDLQWATLTDSAYVFAVPGPLPARYETVPLPEDNFALLRVTVFNGPDDPPRIEILDASTCPAERRRPREVTLSPRMTRTEDAPRHETIVTLDLGARRQPFRAIRLDVADASFFRGVAVEARIDPSPGVDGQAGQPLAWQYLGEAPIYRYEELGALRESLRLDIGGRERVLRLRIRNRDDRPLSVRGATVLVPVERLAFEARPGAQYVLRYGEPATAPPAYDLARTAGDPSLFAARALEAELLSPRPVPSPPPSPAPWTERNPALLWTGLVPWWRGWARSPGAHSRRPAERWYDRSSCARGARSWPWPSWSFPARGPSPVPPSLASRCPRAGCCRPK